MNIDNKNIGVRALPELVTTEPVLFEEVTNLESDSDDVGFLSAEFSAALEMGFDCLGISRSFTLLGVDGKALVEENRIGEEFIVADSVKWIVSNCAHRPAPSLSIQPAIAAATTEAVDRNYVQAIASVNALFLKGNEPKMSQRDAHYLKRCMRHAADPSRMFFRFAQMYYYYRQLETQEVHVRPTPATANPVGVDSIAGVVASLRNGAAGVNYLPFDLDSYSGDAATAATILRYAAEGSPFQAVPGYSISSVLLMDIELPDVQVLLTGTGIPTIVNPNFHSSEIWDMLHSLAGQIDCKDIANEMLSTVAACMYSPYPDKDAVYRQPLLYVHLPPLNMSYYGIFPICIAADAIIEPSYPDEESMHVQACTMVLRSQLLSVAYREVLWSLGLGATFPSARHAAQAAKWRRNLHRKGRRPYAPVVGIMSEYLRRNGCPVTMSQTFAGITPAASGVGMQTLNNAMQECSSWIDVLDVVVKAPMAALDAYTSPKKSSKLMQPKVRYKLDSVSEHAMPSNVAALQACGAEFEMIHKRNDQLNWSVSKIVPLKGKYGIPADRPFPNMSVDSYSKSHVTVRLPDAASAVKMHNLDQVKKNWKWYISGTGREIAGDVIEEDLPDETLFESGDSAGPLEPETETGPPPDPASPSVRQFGDIIKDVTSAVKEQKSKNEDAPRMAHGVMDKRSKWTYDDMKKAAKGIIHDAADCYREAVLAQSNQPGRDIKAHMEPLISPVAHGLSSISLAEALTVVERPRRVFVANAIAKGLQTLSACTSDQTMAKNLCVGAQRALNLAQAMKKCSALNKKELADDNMAWSDEADTILEAMNQPLTEMGMSLDDFAAPKAVGIETQVVGSERAKEMEDDGWRLNRNQEGVPEGEVKMYRPKKSSVPKANFEAVMTLITDAQEKTMAKAEAFLNSLMRPTHEKVEETDGGDEDVRAKVVDLPSGMEEHAREEEAAKRRETREAEAKEVQAAELRKQISHFRQRESDYNDPSRKKYVHDKALALQVALDSGQTADELAEAMINAIGQPTADFGKAGAPAAAILAGSLELPNITAGSASDADLDVDEDALGPPPISSQESEQTSIVDPDALPSLETI